METLIRRIKKAFARPQYGRVPRLIRDRAGQAYTEYVVILVFGVFMIFSFSGENTFLYEKVYKDWLGEIFFLYYYSVVNYLNITCF